MANRLKFRIRRGDTVLVLAGKDKGRKGRVTKALPERNRVMVEGVNMIRRHVKSTAEQPGRIMEREAALHISNVAFWDAERECRVKIGWEILDDGSKVRVDRKTGHQIDNL